LESDTQAVAMSILLELSISNLRCFLSSPPEQKWGSAEYAFTNLNLHGDCTYFATARISSEPTFGWAPRESTRALDRCDLAKLDGTRDRPRKPDVIRCGLTIAVHMDPLDDALNAARMVTSGKRATGYQPCVFCLQHMPHNRAQRPGHGPGGLQRSLCSHRTRKGRIWADPTMLLYCYCQESALPKKF
jgi:hypothetical protein